MVEFSLFWIIRTFCSFVEVFILDPWSSRFQIWDFLLRPVLAESSLSSKSSLFSGEVTKIGLVCILLIFYWLRPFCNGRLFVKVVVCLQFLIPKFVLFLLGERLQIQYHFEQPRSQLILHCFGWHLLTQLYFHLSLSCLQKKLHLKVLARLQLFFFFRRLLFFTMFVEDNCFSKELHLIFSTMGPVVKHVGCCKVPLLLGEASWGTSWGTSWGSSFISQSAMLQWVLERFGWVREM